MYFIRILLSCKHNHCCAGILLLISWALPYLRGKKRGLWSVLQLSLRMGCIVYAVRSMRGAGCTVWPVLSVNSQHAGTQQPCRQSCQGPRSSSPSHQCESPWADLSWSPHLFQPLPKTKVGVNLKASLRGCSARGLTAVQSGLPTLGSGFPVMVLSSSWRCGQLPWEYQPGLSSDGSPSLSSTSLTGGEEREWDTTNSRLQHDRTASSPPAPNLVS